MRIEENARLNEFRKTRHRLAWLINTRTEISEGVNIKFHVTEKIYKGEIIKSNNDLINNIINTM